MNSNAKLLRGRSVEVCRQCGCVTECFFSPCTNCCVGVFLWTLKFTSETSEDAGDPI